MTYIELINEFWKQNGFMPFGAMDTTVYFYLLHQCNIRGWHNPFQLQTRDIEFHLSITRKQIGESKNRLKNRGLIDFTRGSRKDNPTYTILGLPKNMFLTETQTETQIETQIETQTETHLEEIPPTPPKEEYTPKGVEVKNNNILLTRTREEQDLAKFDALLREVIDGKHQLWADQMRKKHHIDNVTDYLPLFRSHVIANSTVHRVSDINGFKGYFNVAFRYFSVLSPLELLARYEKESSSDTYRHFCKWVYDNAPNVAQEVVPLTEQEFLKLREEYGGEKIATTVLDLSNRKDLLGKYYSLYRTLITWLDKNSLQ